MARRDIYKDGAATQFSSENQPEGRGRPVGVKNRSTVLKKWLLTELDVVDPITRKKQRGTVEDEVILALITQARRGEIAAIREVLDTMYGRLTDKVQVDINNVDAAREAFQSILSETGISEEKAREIVAARFGISEQELVIDTDRVM